jgi:bifunctional DNA-binding transcriptional regulator/antitoxin component of YhaV-PrlF toxin-antitoxin module
MTQTKITKAYQTTISAEAIRVLGLRPGQRVNQIIDGNRLILEPVEDADALPGSLGKGKRTHTIEEMKRRHGPESSRPGLRGWSRPYTWLPQSQLMRASLSGILERFRKNCSRAREAGIKIFSPPSFRADDRHHFSPL